MPRAAVPHTARGGDSARHAPPAGIRGGQHRRGAACRGGRAFLRPALFPAVDAPPPRNLRRAVARTRALPAHGKGVGRCGGERVGGGPNPARRGAHGNPQRRPRGTRTARSGIRDFGGGARGRRLGTRRPETREHHRNPCGRVATDRFRRRVPARIQGLREPRAGHGGIPAPRPHGEGLRCASGRLSRRPYRHDPCRHRRGRRLGGPLCRKQRHTLRAAEHKARAELRRDAAPFHGAGRRDPLPHGATAHISLISAAGVAATAAVCRRNARRHTLRRHDRAVCRERLVGLPHLAPDHLAAALDMRFRLLRGAGGGAAEQFVALHRHRRACCGEFSRRGGFETRPRRDRGCNTSRSSPKAHPRGGGDFAK